MNLAFPCPTCGEGGISWTGKLTSTVLSPASCRLCGALSFTGWRGIVGVVVFLAFLVGAYSSFHVWSWWPLAAFVAVWVATEVLFARYAPLIAKKADRVPSA